MRVSDWGGSGRPTATPSKLTATRCRVDRLLDPRRQNSRRFSPTGGAPKCRLAGTGGRRCRAPDGLLSRARSSAPTRRSAWGEAAEVERALAVEARPVEPVVRCEPEHRTALAGVRRQHHCHAGNVHPVASPGTLAATKPDLPAPIPSLRLCGAVCLVVLTLHHGRDPPTRRQLDAVLGRPCPDRL